MENTKPSENVYLLTDQRPCKDDADQRGHVLYYSQSVGWHQGFWGKSHMPDATHWTYLPERPPAVVPREHLLETAFNRWQDNAFPKVEPAVKLLLRLGFMAGADYENRGE